MSKIKEAFKELDKGVTDEFKSIFSSLVSFWNRLGKIPKRAILYLVSLLGIAALYMVQYGFIWWWDQPSMSQLPYKTSVAWLACIIYRAVDDLVYTNVPSYQQFKTNPIAYAIYMSGYAFIIGMVFQYT